ncbi:hypothetical protein BKA25_000345 [Actinoalloteichus hymeniacidonis]|uniref:Uncharacterized protein n=1 Tax=Actinoalloteichus hymeniacidonis TaxID=340345 RepID=A0AAC9HUC9_9PSEU|nr:hypothetical protein TL08_25505 [Actinoalloteichus hymeniacidonis]MBB5906029.1 hypothetical protein [Actinoalloteichus hymeniacidonis]
MALAVADVVSLHTCVESEGNTRSGFRATDVAVSCRDLDDDRKRTNR